MPCEMGTHPRRKAARGLLQDSVKPLSAESRAESRIVHFREIRHPLISAPGSTGTRRRDPGPADAEIRGVRVSGSGFVEMFSDDARRPTTNAAPSPAEVLRAETLAPGRSEGGNDPGASDEMKCSTTTACVLRCTWTQISCPDMPARCILLCSTGTADIAIDWESVRPELREIQGPTAAIL